MRYVSWCVASVIYTVTMAFGNRQERSSRWRISFAVPPLIRRGRTGHAAASHHRKNQEGGDDSALGEPPVKRRRSDFTLLVDHVRSSSVAECGTQVWGAALLLADLLVNVAHELQVPLDLPVHFPIF